MGNENNIQILNQNPKDINDINKKRRTYINNSKLSQNLKNQKNIINFLIKAENGILLPNLNISNSVTLNNICIPNNTLKNNEIKYLKSINYFIETRLDDNKKFYYDYDNNEDKYIKIISDIYNQNNNNIYHKKNYRNQTYNNKENSINYENNNNNLSTFETTERKNNNANNIYNIEDENDNINKALKNLKIFKMGNENNIKRDNEIKKPSSQLSIKTFKTIQRGSNNFINISEYNNNNSFMTNNNKIIYNNRMLITSPGTIQRGNKFKRIMNEENVILKYILFKIFENIKYLMIL